MLWLLDKSASLHSLIKGTLGNIHLVVSQCSSYLSVSLGSAKPSMVVGKPLCTNLS